MREVKSILINDKKEFRLVGGSKSCIDRYTKLPDMSTKEGKLGKKSINEIITTLKLLDNDIPTRHKEFFQYCQETYGKKVWERFNKLMYREWVIPVRDFSSVAYNPLSGGYDYRILRKLHDNLDTLNAVKDDGLMNVYPIVALKGLSPDRLKKDLGKGLWKRLCSNSKTRNELLVRCVMKIDFEYKDPRDLYSLNTIPSTLLKRGIICEDWKNLLPKFGALKCFDKQEVIKYKQHKQDTILMAERLGKTTNPKWSAARWENEHDNFSKEINMLKYSDKLYPYLVGKESIYGITSTSHKGLKATILKSPLEMNTEGSAMRHCIGSYHDRVDKNWRDIFYSITENGKRVSSLQLNLNYPVEPNAHVRQHYGFANSIIKDPKILEFIKEIQSTITLNIKNKGW